MTPAHSSLGASSAKRWMTCPGSVALCAAVPPAPSSKHADEGTVAHWVGETALKRYVAGIPIGWGGYQGNFCPEVPDHAITYEMVGYVHDYVEYVAKLAGAHRTRILVEQRFDLSWIYPGMFGTSDASVYDPERKHLDVIDLKYGAGVAVDAQDNPQGAFYSIGAAADVWHEVETIAFHIYQPRISSTPSVWEFTRAELHEWAARFKRAAELASASDAPRIYDAEACRWCAGRQLDPTTGRPYCPQYSERQQQAVRDVKAACAGPAVGVMSPDELAAQLSMFEEAEQLIKSRVTALKLWATDLSDKMGRDIPGYKLVQRRATRKWQNPDELIAILRYGHGLSDEQIYSSELRSPAQLEKLRDAEGNKIVAPDVVKQYTDKADNGVELVPVSDQRAAIAPRRIALPELPAGVKPFVQGE